MKKILKIVSALVLSMMLILGTTAFADSSVKYEGGAEKFVFLDGSKYSSSDLFGNFKDVMPGDELSQTIKIKNSFRDADTVKIYIRAVAHDAQNPLSANVAAETDIPTMQDFLSQLSMRVTQGDKIIFEASPEQLDGLKENVLLGSFPKNSGTELVVTLSVPLELGNEFQSRIGEVDWVFTAEEICKPTPKPCDPSIPKTGDESSAALWAALLLLSGTGAAVFYTAFKKKI